jgi:hypothetical protein
MFSGVTHGVPDFSQPFGKTTVGELDGGMWNGAGEFPDWTSK